VSRLPIFSDLDVPPECLPHSVTVSRASRAPDAAYAPAVSDSSPGGPLACLIADDGPQEAPDAWGRQVIRWTHTVYFYNADPGLAPNDLLTPQDDRTRQFRVVSVVPELRAGVVWTVRCLEQPRVR
jgi:hypothetical protein